MFKKLPPRCDATPRGGRLQIARQERSAEDAEGRSRGTSCFVASPGSYPQQHENDDVVNCDDDGDDDDGEDSFYCVRRLKSASRSTRVSKSTAARPGRHAHAGTILRFAG